MPEETYYATGRRKEAIARVWLIQGKTDASVNDVPLPDYLKRDNLKMLIEQPLLATQMMGRFGIRARVTGGGVAGQAGAIRLGVARALIRFDEKLRPTLRQGGFLTRDPREKERKKCGRKGARKRFQYTKR